MGWGLVSPVSHTLNEAHLPFLIPAGYEVLLMSRAGSRWLVQVIPLASPVQVVLPPVVSVLAPYHTIPSMGSYPLQPWIYLDRMHLGQPLYDRTATLKMRSRSYMRLSIIIHGSGIIVTYI